ncbi:MAG: hypothetical protein DMG97_14965 [Acidobacteria bacterium]|nr:MAG: hypothetical protein DMG97_14965 [Acidobacteriota bacterium]
MEFMPRETVDFVVNMTYHDVTHKAEIYELLIHELAHNVVRSNDHLCAEFYKEVTTLGAKLAILALEKPELFNTPSNFSQRLKLALPARAGAASRPDR